MAGLAIIAALVLLFLWAGRLGDVGKGLGEGVRAFKQSMNEAEPPRRKKKRKKKPARQIAEADSELDDAVWQRRHASAPKRTRDEDEDN